MWLYLVLVYASGQTGIYQSTLLCDIAIFALRPMLCTDSSAFGDLNLLCDIAIFALRPMLCTDSSAFGDLTQSQLQDLLSLTVPKLKKVMATRVALVHSFSSFHAPCGWEPF
jgi:hypothetical protein